MTGDTVRIVFADAEEAALFVDAARRGRLTYQRVPDDDRYPEAWEPTAGIMSAEVTD